VKSERKEEEEGDEGIKDGRTVPASLHLLEMTN
jgi:hypothetical protein